MLLGAAALFVFVVLIVVVLIVVSIGSSNVGRDEPSYQAGYAWGVNYGRGINKEIAVEGPANRYSDAEIRHGCHSFAADFAKEEWTYYSENDHRIIRGQDIHVDDYTDGCVGGVRSVVKR